MWLFALFIAVPLIEIALFIQIGGILGLGRTLLIVVITALLGTVLVRQQGLQALASVQRSFAELSDPTEPLAHGIMILFSGALLLTPGFFTDAFGFALLIPEFRVAMFTAIRKRIKVQTIHPGQPRTGPRPRPQDDTVIDGDFREVDPANPPEQSSSGWTRH